MGYVAVRAYFNPDGDHMELSETAWKEKRLYRYYKFTNNLTVSQQGRGYAQGIFMITAFCLSYLILGLIDLETCVQYRDWRLWRKDELRPWLNDAYANGYIWAYNYSRAKMNEIWEKDLPEMEKIHDDKAYTKRSWKKAMCLKECLARDSKWDSPYHYNQVDYEMPPKAHPAYQAFVRQEAEKESALGLSAAE